MTQPLLSFYLITFNQIKYIEQAIEGVLKQKVDFPIELVIGDVFSTHRTRELLLKYQEKYPGIIRLISKVIT